MSKQAVASPFRSPVPESGQAGARATRLWLAVGLLVLTTAVYAPVRNYGFIKLDDTVYVTQNEHVNAGLTRNGFVWAWTAPHSATWHPLTTLSHMLDCQLFGLRPGAHHLGNLLLHVLNVLLLFGFLVRTTARPWRSAWVAALFALHPLHVESVAWISERKDVLSTAFWLLTLWAYAGYVKRPAAHRYALMLIVYAAALLSKPMVVTLPFVLLLLDVWPLGRVPWEARPLGDRRLTFPHVPASLFIEKLPLVMLAAIVSVITYLAQASVGSVVSLTAIPLSARAANAIVSYAAYLVMMLWPAKLTVFYPFESPLPAADVWGAAAFLMWTSVAVLWKARHYPFLLIGWLWYLGMLVPVIGLVHQGDQSMADRFTYLPLVGIFIMAAWGIPELVRRWPHAQSVCAAAALSALVACIVLTSRQLELWRDNSSLFEHALAVTRNNFVAQFCIGLTVLDEGRRDEAATRFAESLRIRPTYEPAHYEMGRLREAEGALDAAKQEYLEVVHLNPMHVNAYLHLARLFAREGDLDTAQAWTRRAIGAAPDNPEARFHLGLLAARAKDWDTAVSAYTAAIRLSPAYAEAHLKLADALLTLEHHDQAIQEYTAALQADPANAEAQEHFGVALLMEKRVDEALDAFRAAVKLKPDFAAAYNHWGVALSLQGRFDEAIERYRTALRYDPTDQDAQYNLHLAEQGRSAGPRTAAP